MKLICPSNTTKRRREKGWSWRPIEETPNVNTKNNDMASHPWSNNSPNWFAEPVDKSNKSIIYSVFDVS